MTNVVEQVVASSALGGNEVHHLLNDCGSGGIVAVCRFPVLEIGVAVLRGALLNGVLGVERAGLEVCYVCGDTRSFANCTDFGIVVRVVPNVYLGNFVGGSETVEEVNERHFAFKR